MNRAVRTNISVWCSRLQTLSPSRRRRPLGDRHRLWQLRRPLLLQTGGRRRHVSGQLLLHLLAPPDRPEAPGPDHCPAEEDGALPAGQIPAHISHRWAQSKVRLIMQGCLFRCVFLIWQGEIRVRVNDLPEHKPRDYSRYTSWLVPAQDPCLFTLDFAFFSPSFNCRLLQQHMICLHSEKKKKNPPPGSAHPSAHELFLAKLLLAPSP